ncbi:putative H23L24.5 [Operophtera brumata]|uniref:Putative H23L24.5 n=1 Tax=Operophtera brumata TaxID=104452 RepID=A0A0L7LJB3_OPEBR|nr:putative H23L24.5 [Operophtera brumata]
MASPNTHSSSLSRSGEIEFFLGSGIGIDPEDDVKDPELMKGLEKFFEEEMTDEERRQFLDNTVRIMVTRALHLRRWRPPSGLMKSQRNKLKSLLHYFEWLDKNNNEGSVKISRQVMTSKQWLTIEDWLECTLPLCKLHVRHEGRPERCENDDAIRVCFASSRLGGDALIDGDSQESLSMFMMPELLPAMLSVEALEDNEVLKVEGVTVCLMDAEDYSKMPLSQWEEDNVLRELNKCLLAFQQTPMKSKENARLERRLSPIGESFSHTPPEVEATVVVKQASTCSTLNSFNSRSPSPQNYCAATLNLNDPSVELTKRKCWLSPDGATLNNRRGKFIVLGSSGECLPVTRPANHTDTQEDSLYSSCNSSDDEFHSANDSFDYGSEDEGRGESARPNSFHYSKELSTEERRMSFASRLRDALRREAEHSCTTSTTGDWSTDSSSYAVGISISGAGVNDNDIRVKRGGSVGFVLTEKETISNGDPSPRDRPLGRKETGNSSKYSFSTEYTSELEEVYEQFNQWLSDPIVDAESGEHKTRELDSRDLAVIRFAGSLLKRTLSESMASGPSSGAGSAEAAELYGPGRDSTNRAPRRLALAARSLSLELARHRHRLAAQLKRKVKESIPEKILKSTQTSSEDETRSEDSVGNSTETGTTQVSNPNVRKKKLNWMLNMIVETIEETVECEPVTVKLRKPKLNQLAHKIVTGGSCRPVATGNWGCGRRQRGQPQLKMLLQWLAASVAGVPALIYYTAGNEQLFKLDTLVRVIVDRKWTVGQLARAVLRFARRALEEPHGSPDSQSLFDDLIGIEKTPDS